MQDTKKLGSVEGRLEAEGSKRDTRRRFSIRPARPGSPGGSPYPLLVIAGEQGSAKTSSRRSCGR